MTPHKYKDTFKALEKAADAIENAKYNLKGGFIAATANRSYYACYYCMIALLYTQNVYAKTHQGTRAKFTELFIKTSVFPIGISDSIALIFDYRQEADYNLDEDITREEATNLINKAVEFYQLVLAHLPKIIGHPM